MAKTVVMFSKTEERHQSAELSSKLAGQRAEIVVSVSLCFDSWLRASYVEFTYLSRAFLFLCTPASI